MNLMNREKYILRGTDKNIFIDMDLYILKIDEKIYHMNNTEMNSLDKLYCYSEEIFKEFIENIYIKYDFSVINFLINNKITLKEIKEITNIILFPLNFYKVCKLKKICLKDYDINIIDFFKYIYSQPYHMITEEYLFNYINYILKKIENKTLNKNNLFPHNLDLSLKLIENKENFIIRNNKKDIIRDIDGFHLEFYGNRCEYFITYKNKKYNLVSKKERTEIYNIIYDKETWDFLYLSEYYECGYLSDIIDSFKFLYYKNEIKEGIYYILKDSYEKLGEEELKSFQNMILNINKEINWKKIDCAIDLFKKNPLYAKILLNNNSNYFNKNLLTSNFKENIFITYFLSNSYLKEEDYKLFNKYKKTIIYNSKRNIVFNAYNKSIAIYASLDEVDNKKIEYKDLQIEPLHLLNIINYTNNNNIYFEKTFNKFLYKSIYLCKNIKTKEEIILIFDENLKKIEPIKQLNKEYSKEFLNKIKEIKIKEI